MGTRSPASPPAWSSPASRPSSACNSRSPIRRQSPSPSSSTPRSRRASRLTGRSRERVRRSSPLAATSSSAHRCCSCAQARRAYSRSTPRLRLRLWSRHGSGARQQHRQNPTSQKRTQPLPTRRRSTTRHWPHSGPNNGTRRSNSCAGLAPSTGCSPSPRVSTPRGPRGSRAEVAAEEKLDIAQRQQDRLGGPGPCRPRRDAHGT